MKTLYSIVGQKHRGFDPYLAGTMPGTPVMLIREPTNRYDKNAVMVWIKDQHVGYIPSKENTDLAAHIDMHGRTTDRGFAIDATFARSPHQAYPQVEVTI